MYVSDSNDDAEFDGKCENCKEEIENQADHFCFVCGVAICDGGAPRSFTMAGECIDCELWHYW